MREKKKKLLQNCYNESTISRLSKQNNNETTAKYRPQNIYEDQESVSIVSSSLSLVKKKCSS